MSQFKKGDMCPPGTTWKQHGEKRLDEDVQLSPRMDAILEHGDRDSDAFWNWIAVASVREIIKWADSINDIGVSAAG